MHHYRHFCFLRALFVSHGAFVRVPRSAAAQCRKSRESSPRPPGVRSRSRCSVAPLALARTAVGSHQAAAERSPCLGAIVTYLSCHADQKTEMPAGNPLQWIPDSYATVGASLALVRLATQSDHVLETLSHLEDLTHPSDSQIAFLHHPNRSRQPEAEPHH